ncbi:MAG TPA: ATP-binding protein [Bdellovibrionales bacterium]|jgi:signal transduction histidine kinase|nr:ATP-binding protein [Bdellovibrionales bacterium]
MLKIIRNVAEWGIAPENTAEQANHIRLTNVLLLFMFVASIVETLVCYWTGAIQAALLNSTAPLVFGGGLLLMKAGWTITARLMVVSVSYFAGYILMTILGPESYFQFIFLFASAFSVVFFSSSERVLLIVALTSPLICFATLEATQYQPILGFSRAEISFPHLLLIRTVSIAIIWTLMISHFIYYVRGRRQAQEQLISAAKMVAMGRMASGIAHEVNNPLQRIVSHADHLKDLARSGSVSPEQINDLSSQIQKVAMRIASIVKGLLALSRDASSEPLLEVPLHSIVNLSLDYCRARMESHQVELKVGEIPKDWMVRGRETQLSEVILNILSNAHDAVVEQSVRWIQIDAMAELKWIDVSITDSGAGIHPLVRNRIFDPFFTTKPIGKGTGLGLSISQGIMAAHGGHIIHDYKATVTRFVVRIPRAEI